MAVIGVLWLATRFGAGDDRPSDWPGPALAWSGCGDLDGTYRVDAAPGSNFGREALPLTQLRPAAHHTRWSLEPRPDGTLTVRSWATAAELRQAFEAWRNEETYVQAPGVTMLRRGPTLDAELVSRRFAPDIEHGFWDESTMECRGGWWTADVPASAIDRGGAAPTTGLHLARAGDGGLIAYYESEYEESFSLWCGDGCKGIPLGTRTRRHWAWWPAAEARQPEHVDWAAWIANDPRPVRAPDIHTTYQHPPLREVDAQSRAAAAKAKAQATLASSEEIVARVIPLLPRGSGVTEVSFDAPDTIVRGYAVTMSQVSEILRALENASGQAPELMLIERETKSRQRFELRLPPSALTLKQH